MLFSSSASVYDFAGEEIIVKADDVILRGILNRMLAASADRDIAVRLALRPLKYVRRDVRIIHFVVGDGNAGMLFLKIRLEPFLSRQISLFFFFSIAPNQKGKKLKSAK